MLEFQCVPTRHRPRTFGLFLLNAKIVRIEVPLKFRTILVIVFGFYVRGSCMSAMKRRTMAAVRPQITRSP